MAPEPLTVDRYHLSAGDGTLTRPYVVLAIVLATGAVFALDLQMPLGVAIAVLYVPVLALGSMALGRRGVLRMALAITVLILTAWALKPAGGVPWMAAVNRVACVVAVWGVALCRLRRHHGW